MSRNFPHPVCNDTLGRYDEGEVDLLALEATRYRVQGHLRFARPHVHQQRIRVDADASLERLALVVVGFGFVDEVFHEDFSCIP